MDVDPNYVSSWGASSAYVDFIKADANPVLTEYLDIFEPGLIPGLIPSNASEDINGALPDHTAAAANELCKPPGQLQSNSQAVLAARLARQNPIFQDSRPASLACLQANN
jgi:hypothetical protein